MKTHTVYSMAERGPDKEININAKKSQKHKKFNKWFKPSPNVSVRRKTPKFLDTFSRTVRFEKLPLSYLTKLLNHHYDRQN